MPFSDAERATILEDWSAVVAIPLPPDTRQIGCAVAILAVAAAAGLPPLLGAALPFVIEVEQVLVHQTRTYPVFMS